MNRLPKIRMYASAGASVVLLCNLNAVVFAEAGKDENNDASKRTEVEFSNNEKGVIGIKFESWPAYPASSTYPFSHKWHPKIMKVYPGSPADAAGVLKGDRVILVDNTHTEGLTLPALYALLIGPVGNAVNLTILRKKNQLTFSCIRVPIEALKDGAVVKRYHQEHTTPSPAEQIPK